MIKLIACDLDGTLLNSRQELSQYNAQMIKEAQEIGIEFMIATGRNMNMIRPFLHKYDLQCACLLMNGAEARDRYERIVSSINVSKEIIRTLHEDLVDRGYMPFYNSSENIYYNGTDEGFKMAIGYRQQCLDRDSKALPLKIAIEHGMKSAYAANAKRFDTISLLADNDEIEIRKIVVFHPDTHMNTETIRYLEKKYTCLAIGASYPEDIEINDFYAQKGYGLLTAIKAMGISRDEVAVFGDGLNDISLFREFSNSFAPINAVADIKDLAHEIIPSNEDDGVGRIIAEIVEKQKNIMVINQ